MHFALLLQAQMDDTLLTNQNHFVMRFKTVTLTITFVLLATAGLFGQERTITGTVRDANRDPIVGAGILIEGTTKGTISSMDGTFSLSVPEGQVRLAVSSLGYIPQKITVDATQRIVNVILLEDALDLEGTVVVGYGVQKKVNLTGAIASVSSTTLEQRVSPTLTHMLQGVVPGLNVTTSSGRPGNSANINIRGINSINGGNPLVLVDGAEGNLARINPADVESISVIKDASAAAIYGARASFGVILVTTKAGMPKEDYARVQFSSRVGWQEPTTSTDFETRGYYSVYLNDLFFKAYNGKNYTVYTEEDMTQLWARVNDRVENPQRPWVMIDQRNGRDTYVYYANTDWWHELFQDRRPSMQHSISLGGSSGRVNYFLSGAYNYEQGLFRRNTDILNRYNFRSKLSFDINSWISMSNNTSFYKYRYEYPGASGVNTVFSLMTVHALASYPAHNPDGTSIGFTSFADNNFVMDGFLTVLDEPNYRNKDEMTDFRTTTEVIFKPLGSLEIRTNFTYALDQNRYSNRALVTYYSQYPGEIIAVNNSRSIDRLTETYETHNYYSVNAYATWARSFYSNHNVKLMGGFNWETKHLKDNRAIGYYLMSQTLSDLNLVGADADGNQRMEVSGGQNEYALAGFFGRINYDYQERYLLELSGRYDGSSRFASSHRWGFFPSASAGWRISEEPFFASVKPVVNNLKVRYSYGALGNQQVGYYDYIREVKISTGSYLFGTGAKPTIATIGAPVASNLTWERTVQHDLGVDVALLGNRMVFTADAYIRDTKDMLTAGKTLPAVYGASSPKMNAADLRTRGYELQLMWRDSFTLANRPFSYSATATFSDYWTTITKFDNPNRSLAQSYYEGMRWGEIWGYYTDGLFADDVEASSWPIDQSYVNNGINSSAGSERGLRGGDLKFRDLDGDGKIGIGENTVDNPGDRRIIGNSEPRYNYGLNVALMWGGFDFSVFFQGIGKLDWAPATNNVLFWGPYARPYATLIPRDFHKMIWSEDNPNAYYPRPRGYVALGSNRELTVPTDRYLQNIAYCRLKSLNVGYTLPKKLLSQAGIEDVRIYFSGENLAKWSGIHSDYIDPEMAQTNTTNRIYPWQKSYMFGIDLTF